MLEFDYRGYAELVEVMNNGVIDDDFIYVCCVEIIQDQISNSLYIDYEMLMTVFTNQELEPKILGLLFDRDKIKVELEKAYEEIKADKKVREKELKKLEKLKDQVRKLERKLEL